MLPVMLIAGAMWEMSEGRPIRVRIRLMFSRRWTDKAATRLFRELRSINA